MVHNDHNNYTVLTDDQVIVIIVHLFFLLLLLNHYFLITPSILLYSMMFSSHAPLCKQPSIGFLFPGRGGGWACGFSKGIAHRRTLTHTHTHTHATTSLEHAEQ